MRNKISLVIVLSLGWLVCVAGIWKAVEQAKLSDDPDASFKNRFAVLYMLELCLGILAASLPTLKPLFAAALGSARGRYGSSCDDTSSTGPSTVPIGFQRNSHIRIPDSGNDQVELPGYNKSTLSATTTTTESDVSSAADSSAAGSANVQCTIHRSDSEFIRKQWKAFRPIRNPSQERLHQPVSSFSKEVLVVR